MSEQDKAKVDQTESDSIVDEKKEAPEGTQEASEQKKNNKVRIGIIVGLIVLLLVAAGCVAFALAQQDDSPAPAPVIETEEQKLTTVTLTLEAKDVDGNGNEVIVDADVEIILTGEAELLDEDAKTINDNITMGLNEKTEIAKLPAGTYQLHILSAPIELDGSTYRLPKEAIDFTVLGEEGGEAVHPDGSVTVASENDGVITHIVVKLERIDVEALTQEQLDAVIARLEAAKGNHDELIADLTERKNTAESDPESAKDVAQDSTSEVTSDTSSGSNGGSTSGNTGGNTGGSSNSGSSNNGSTGGNTGGTTQPPAHQHSFTTPVYGEAPLIDPGQAEVAEQGYWRDYFSAYGRIWYNIEEAMQWCLDNGKALTYSVHSEWVVTAPYQPYIAPTYGPAPIIGYTCSGCGARQ